MMNRRFVVSVACLVLACGAYRQTSAAQGVPAHTQSTAPDFTVQDLNQGSITLSSFRGSKPAMLFFWTTWCPYCREELQALAGRYAGLTQQGLAIIVIDVGESSGRVETFAKRYGFPFPVYLDKDESVARSYDLLGVPTYVLIDKKGTMRSTEHSFPELQIRELLAE